MDPPNRIHGFIPASDPKQYTSKQYNFSVTSPEGWSVIEPVQFSKNSPIYLATGPTKDGITPYIYMNVLPLDDTTFVNHMISRINTVFSLNDEGKIDLKTQYIGNFAEGN